MKKFILFLLISSVARGQSFQLGINAGFAACKAPKLEEASLVAFYHDQGQTEPFLSFSAVLNHSIWQCGINADIYPIIATADIGVFTGRYNVDEYRATIFMGNPALSPNFFVDIKHGFGNKFIFAGATLGAVVNPFKEKEITNTEIYTSPYAGLMYQFQAGFAKVVKKQLTFVVQVAVRHVGGDFYGEDYKKILIRSFSQVSVPCTIGLRYTVTRAKPANKQSADIGKDEKK